MASYFLDCRLRGNDTPYPASASPQPASPTGREASCVIRLKCYENEKCFRSPDFIPSYVEKHSFFC